MVRAGHHSSERIAYRWITNIYTEHATEAESPDEVVSESDGRGRVPLMSCLTSNRVVAFMQGDFVSNKPVLTVPPKSAKIVHPCMLGDETEEQNLNETGDLPLSIKKEQVEAAFGKIDSKKP